jgi:CubicO group peptidase (beta-lactamase class C family)
LRALRRTDGLVQKTALEQKAVFVRRGIDWAECDPAILGVDPSRLSRVVELVEARGAMAQLCVILDGKVLLDRSFACQTDSLFWIFSACKPYVALLIHLLVEREQASLDDPVATYWPEFGRHGKDRTTIRHVLQHRTGLFSARVPLGDALAMTDWDRCVRRIENSRPRWPAGLVPAYQALSYGYILGELVHRITGTAVQEFLTTELLAPLRAHDTYLGLPDTQWQRHVPVVARGLAGRVLQAFLNRRSTRRAVIPSAGLSTTARDLAAFYLMLLQGGVLGGEQILPQAIIDRARAPSSRDGEIDRCIKTPVRWSHGFQLGGSRPAPYAPGPLGHLSSPRTFGHNGSNCCIGWVDPDRNLVVVYLTNRLEGRRVDRAHQAAVADGLLRACGRVSPVESY